MVNRLRNIGIITKGLLYSLIGLLTFLAALDLGGKISGKNEVISFLKNQPLGKFILIAIGIGLLLYSLWRFYASFMDAKKVGKDKKGIFKRIGYFFSGLIYGALTISLLFNTNSSTDNTKQQIANDFMQNKLGIIILFITALVLFGTGIYQFYKGYSYKFFKEINFTGSSSSNEFVKKLGKFGHMARGIAFVIFAYFLGKATFEKNATAIRGLEGMFTFLKELSFGNILMAIVALGFLFYGIFQFFLAKYSNA